MDLDEMKATHAAGWAVLHRGQIIAPGGMLPTAAELAVGNPVAEAKAAEDVQTQIAALQAQLAQLQAGKEQPPLELDPALEHALAAAGFDTKEKIAAAPDAELKKIDGVNAAALKQIRAVFG